MQSNGFWEFLVSVESEYSKYRKRIMNRFSLSSAEVDVLMFLANNPALDTAADISRIRHIPKSQVSLSVRSLCDDGLVVGTYANGNRKSVHLAVTKKAERIVDYGKDVQKEFYERHSKQIKSLYPYFVIKVSKPSLTSCLLKS